jgi:hypothetical protein
MMKRTRCAYNENMTERQKFELMREFDKFELRRYEPCVIAEVEMNSDYRSAANGAFRHLFSYISKGNEGARGISMTAPVISSTENSIDSESWKIAFVMPAGSKLSELPLPLDSRVHLVELGFQDCVVLGFRGRATKHLSSKWERRLREFAAEECIELSPELRIHRFDPPFKPGFLQYNEIVIPTNTAE